MNQALLYPGIAMMISILGFAHTLYRDKKVALKTETSELQAKIDKLEARIASLEQEKRDWAAEKIELMAKVIRLQNGA